MPGRKSSHRLIELEQVLLIVAIEIALLSNHNTERISCRYTFSKDQNVWLQRNSCVRMSKKPCAEKFRRAECKVNVIHNEGNAREIFGTVVALLLQGVKPTSIVITRDGTTNATRGIGLLAGRAGLVDASEVLHRIDHDASDAVVIFLNEIETALGALRQEYVVGTVDERDSRYMAMIGRSESHDDLLWTGRCSNILEGGIYSLRATERVANLLITSKWDTIKYQLKI